MRTRNTWMIAGGVALALGAAACDNSKLPSINDNPNAPTTAPAGAVFTNAERLAAARWMGTGFDLRGTEFVSQQVAEAQYPDEDRYNRLQGPNTTGFFDGAYVGELEDLQKVILAGNTQNDPSIWGPATVLQVWVWANLTNVWGDIPYADALTGDSSGGTLTPAYEGQDSIYASMFSRLASAVTAMEGVAGQASTMGNADVIYNGDLTKWEKFGNSLRARLALQVVNVDPTLTDAQLKAAFTDPAGVFTSNDDNAQLVWPGDGVYDNPWADNMKTRDDERMSRTLMTIMVGTNDPRVPIYAQPVADSSVYPNGYGGMPNGLTADSAGKWSQISSRPGTVFYPGATTYGTFGTAAGLSFPSFLMTYAEVSFIQAEAAARGLGGLAAGDAGTYYANGIQASMAQWGVSNSAAVTAFMAEPAVAYTTNDTTGLDRIATQKYVALFSDGTQAWNEWRRTCIPATVVAGPAAIVNFVPRRFEYSQTEYSVNADALNAAIGSQGPDTFGSHMWWDTNLAAAPTYNAAACNTP